MEKKRNSYYYAAELFQAADLFDGIENDYVLALVKDFNSWLVKQDDFTGLRLDLPEAYRESQKTIWIDTTQDNLPVTRESSSITQSVIVVNTREWYSDSVAYYSFLKDSTERLK
ncbi:MAG: hypothetical protein ABIH89_02775 [Elusimicrobiota bacterium]